MNVLSLFSGIGGLELGLERAGMTVVGQVELDPFCRRVLAKHWPEVPKHDDVRTAVGWWLGTDRPAVDLVCGGFPCQPFSTAGRREGVTDERWGWPWFWDVIRALRPRYVLVENVAALIRDGDAFGWLLADPAAGGYDAEWDCIPAAAIGAPHRRDRLFLVAYASGIRRGEGPWVVGGVGAAGRGTAMADADGAGLEGRGLPGAVTQRDCTVADAARRERQPAQSQGLATAGWPTPEPGERRGCTRPLGNWWATEPDVGRVAHGVPNRVDRLRALGNAVVPQVAEHIGRLIVRAVV